MSDTSNMISKKLLFGDIIFTSNNSGIRRYTGYLIYSGSNKVYTPIDLVDIFMNGNSSSTKMGYGDFMCAAIYVQGSGSTSSTTNSYELKCSVYLLFNSTTKDYDTPIQSAKIYIGDPPQQLFLQ